MTVEITHWLPPEIIREILLKATVETLLRCKSVCKEWFSIISEQHFIKAHYTLSSTNIDYQHHRLVYNIYQEDYNLNSCPLHDVLFDASAFNALLPKDRSPRSRELSIVGSCNGLVCLFVDDDDYDFFIYNPSTKIWNALPFRKEYWNGLPSRRGYWEHEWHSFGYDESTDDYKIVEMSVTKEVNYCVNIYSLKTGKWKIIGDFLYQYPDDAYGIFLNGAIHWVAFVDSSYTQRIVSLDLAKETYGEDLQPAYDEGDMDLRLGVLGECLCGLCYYFESHADLWVMKVYGVKDSWTKLASFSYLTDPWIDWYPVPLFSSNDGNVLFSFASGVVIYNSKDSSYLKKTEYDNKLFGACIVVESLVSPFPPLALADNNEN